MGAFILIQHVYGEILKFELSSYTHLIWFSIIDTHLIYSPKVLVIPRNRWLRLNMTEKLFTGTLNHNKKKNKTKKKHLI